MAWAQRDESAIEPRSDESGRVMRRQLQLEAGVRCESCTRLIAGSAVVVGGYRYCGVECAAEARRTRQVPGVYLG